MTKWKPGAGWNGVLPVSGTGSAEVLYFLLSLLLLLPERRPQSEYPSTEVGAIFTCSCGDLCVFMSCMCFVWASFARRCAFNHLHHAIHMMLWHLMPPFGLNTSRSNPNLPLRVALFRHRITQATRLLQHLLKCHGIGCRDEEVRVRDRGVRVALRLTR